jgi:hypothetical protein
MNKNLVELIELLNKKGFETRSLKAIKSGYDYKDITIIIMNNEQFNIKWYVAIDELELMTNFSNQEINKEYIEKLNYLFERVQYYNATNSITE